MLEDKINDSRFLKQMTKDKFQIYNQVSFEEWRQAWLDHVEGREVTLDLPAFPSDKVQKVTNSKSGRATVEAAWGMYKIFSEEATRYNLIAESSVFTVLDLGAGWGRITRLMLRDVEPNNLFAVDVDKELVDSGKKCMPDINWELIQAGGKLPFDDNSFSLVLSNSVLSHLDEHHHRDLVDEVARVLKPGGIFLGTTLSEAHFLNYLKYEDMKKWLAGIVGNLDDQLTNLRNGQFVYGHSNRLQGYGMTFLPNGWVDKQWSPQLTVLSTRTDYAQDVNVAQKP